MYLSSGRYLLPLCFFCILLPVISFSQGDSVKKQYPATKKWYESIAIRGYTQIRYNRLLETNENLGCEQCD
ncbi:MAG: hypothetical protein ACK5BV_09900, partial [Bacteroidota bacterium]